MEDNIGYIEDILAISPNILNLGQDWWIGVSNGAPS